MAKIYPQAMKEKAFELYDQQVSLGQIEKILGMTRKTLAKWRDQFGWEQRRRANLEVAAEVIDTRCVDRRVMLGEMAQEGLENVLKRVPLERSKQVATVAKAALDLAKVHNLLVGAPTAIEEQRIITVQDLLQVARERPAIREGEKV